MLLCCKIFESNIQPRFSDWFSNHTVKLQLIFASVAKVKSNYDECLMRAQRSTHTGSCQSTRVHALCDNIRPLTNCDCWQLCDKMWPLTRDIPYGGFHSISKGDLGQRQLPGKRGTHPHTSLHSEWHTHTVKHTHISSHTVLQYEVLQMLFCTHERLHKKRFEICEHWQTTTCNNSINQWCVQCFPNFSGQQCTSSWTSRCSMFTLTMRTPRCCALYQTLLCWHSPFCVDNTLPIVSCNWKGGLSLSPSPRLIDLVRVSGRQTSVWVL